MTAMTTQRVALVTGSGAPRVGRAVAKALAGRGYSLVVHYNRSAEEAAQAVTEIQAAGVEAIAAQADLGNEAQARGLVDHALAHYGRLDVLVNCASVWKAQRLETVTADDVRRNFDANVLGTFLCSHQAGLAMVKQPEGGCIITIGDWAVERPYLGYAAYFPSKGAVEALTRSLAVELGTRNPRVRVNCILPGPVMLPLDLPEAERREAINATLVKREGSPEHIAHAVLCLVENDFITGAFLPVDGGRTIYAP